MSDEGQRWFGPGEAAQRLGVTTKALRVYEREGLVVPHRAESGWRLYGPAQVSRLHQVIVLRNLGLPLKSIKKLVGGQSRLGDVLRLQRETLQAQQEKIRGAIDLIETAQRQLARGGGLSLDDLATLTKETVMHQTTDIKKFAAKFEALVSDRDPTGQTSRAVEEMKRAVEELKSNRSDGEEFKAEHKAMMAEAGRLKETGDVNSDAATAMVRRWRSLTAKVKRPTEAQTDVMRDAYCEALAEAETSSEPLPFDPAALEFLRQVVRGMKARGELD